MKTEPTLESRIRELADAYRRAKTDNLELTARMAMLERRIEEMTRERDNLRDQIDASAKERLRLKTLGEEREALRKKLESLTGRLRALEQEL